MNRRLHRSLLVVYARLPRRLRIAVIHAFAPSFSVGTLCVIEHDGEVLLVRHTYRARWGIPGGLLARSEHSEDAARREVREEVGIAITLLGPPEAVVEPRTRRVDLIFRASLSPGVDRDSARPGSPEIAEVRWFPRNELPPLQVESAGAFMALGRRSMPPG